MEWVTELFSIGTAAAGGGIFGLFGTAFGAWMKNKEREQARLEKKADREHEMAMVRLNMEMKSQDASWTALTETHRSEADINRSSNYKWVVAVKSLFRPFLTLFLWVMTAWELHLITSGAVDTLLEAAAENQTLFSVDELVPLVKYVLYSTVFSASTATTWWFGERALSLPEMKNR